MPQSISEAHGTVLPGATGTTTRAERAAKSSPVFRTFGQSAATDRRLQSIRAVVLLEGSVGASPFASAIGRSLLELPVAHQRSFLDVWRDHMKRLADLLGLDRLPCRVVIGRNTARPRLRADHVDAGMVVEHDPSELRGTGGLLRDLSEQYDEQASLLVLNAAQLLVQPLDALTADAATRGGDVTLIANADGTPAGATLVRCAALKCLPAIGFVDFKEQALPLIAKEHQVTVRYCTHPSGLPIRTSADYIAALRAHGRIADGDVLPRIRQPFVERWQSVVAVVEHGAEVAAGAKLHDAVVLRGAIVEPGAVAVRSVVCPGGRLLRNARAVDQCITAFG